MLATTATANARVTADVAEQLGAGRPGRRGGVLVLRGSLDRESLRLGVVRLQTAEMRLAWLADHLAEQPGSGIIYCLTVAATQEVAAYLRDRGHEVAAYSGQTDTTERQALEGELVAGRVKALVATSALGMGFDAALGFVINLGAPQSPVAYYQQVGRAGRGTAEASVVLLPQLEDRDIWAYFAWLAFPPEQLVRQTIAVLARSDRPMSTVTLETYVELSRNRLETMLKVLDVDGAVRRVQGGWVATGSRGPTTPSATRGCRGPAARAGRDADLPRHRPSAGCASSARSSTTPTPATAAGATTAAGSPWPPPSPTPPSPRRAPGCRAPAWRSSRASCGRPRWPTSGSGSRARSAPARRGPGDRPAHRPRPRAGAARAVPEGVADGPVPPSLAAALLTVMKDWSGDWAERPVAIVHVESATRPQLVGDLATGLSRVMQMPVVGSFAIVDQSVAPGRGRRQLRPAGRRGEPALRAARRRAGRSGAARRRPGRQRLDPDRGRRRPARGRRDRRAARRPRHPGLVQAGP